MLRIELVVAVAAGAVGLGVALTEPLRGVVWLVFTPDHGLHAGDLLAAPFFVVSAIVGAGLVPRPSLPRPALAALAVLLIGFGLAALALLDDLLSASEPSSAVSIVAAACVVVLTALGSGALWVASGAGPVRVWRVVVLTTALVAGVTLDAWVAPSGTVFSATLLAFALALCGAAANSRRYWVAVVMLLLVCVAAVADVAGADVLLASRGGGDTRTLALGLLLVFGGLTSVVHQA